jgi:hypothetical protein
MSEPFTLDGGSLVGSYEHVRRVLELDGLPFNGWNEATGGGIAREGQNHVFGAGDTPRGVTDGKAVPQDLELKLEMYTWETFKSFLKLKALSLGDNSDTNHQKVEWQIVDQYRGANPLQPSKTVTTTVKIAAEKPETPNDGNQFYMVLTLKPTSVPQESFG